MEFIVPCTSSRIMRNNAFLTRLHIWHTYTAYNGIAIPIPFPNQSLRRQAGRQNATQIWYIYERAHSSFTRYRTEEAKRASHLLVPTSIGRCAFVKYSELQLSLARITPCARGLPGAHPPILFTDRSWVISALMTYVPSRPRPPRR